MPKLLVKFQYPELARSTTRILTDLEDFWAIYLGNLFWGTSDYLCHAFMDGGKH
ncbi:MAG: hypothetical protein ACI8XV_000131 [Arenicella sp.]|jgi:hypothetical protein